MQKKNHKSKQGMVFLGFDSEISQGDC